MGWRWTYGAFSRELALSKQAAHPRRRGAFRGNGANYAGRQTLVKGEGVARNRSRRPEGRVRT